MNILDFFSFEPVGKSLRVCPVTNMFERVVFVSGGTVLGAMKVDARGAVQ
jgi:hypothetical protein